MSHQSDAGLNVSQGGGGGGGGGAGGVVMMSAARQDVVSRDLSDLLLVVLTIYARKVRARVEPTWSSRRGLGFFHVCRPHVKSTAQ